jgi:DNA-binding CsgD family transcriptional regulator
MARLRFTLGGAAPNGLTALRWRAPDGELVLLGFPLEERPPSRQEPLLTIAELRIAAAMLEGKTSGQIARERGRSSRTVENQVGAIFRKLHVSSRGELAARWAGYLQRVSAAPPHGQGPRAAAPRG